MGATWLGRGHPSLDLNLAVVSPAATGDAVSSSTEYSKHAAAAAEEEEEERRMEFLKAELSRVTEENKKLHRTLESVTSNYAALWNKMNDTAAAAGGSSPSPSPSPSSPSSTTAKRNSGRSVCSVSRSTEGDNNSNCKRMRDGEWKSRVWKLQFRADPKDPSLVVRDGHQWRKYGQKVTRDNPFPRAYFRCSFAPSCPVKKKVQRSKEDATVVEAVYEGEHNHDGQRDPRHSSEQGASPRSRNSSNPGSSPDHVRQGRDGGGDGVVSTRGGLAEEMARSLSGDPTFTAALAAAISGRMFQASN